jgi:diacylglycerol kinase family enzyme
VFLALRAVLGHRRPAELAVVSANEFWIRSSHSRVRIANDGEVINLTPPLHYRSIPGALRVMVPAVKESPAP